jgi:DNA-directed RNA polymerase specialized sigma24 family protein
LSYEEIASVTGRSSGYVGFLLHHAVKTLAAAVRHAEGV